MLSTVRPSAFQIIMVELDGSDPAKDERVRELQQAAARVVVEHANGGLAFANLVVDNVNEPASDMRNLVRTTEQQLLRHKNDVHCEQHDLVDNFRGICCDGALPQSVVRGKRLLLLIAESIAISTQLLDPRNSHGLDGGNNGRNHAGKYCNKILCLAHGRHVIVRKRLYMHRSCCGAPLRKLKDAHVKIHEAIPCNFGVHGDVIAHLFEQASEYAKKVVQVDGGGYAEYCLASFPLCLNIPKKVSLTEAAGLPETFFTVWSNVFEMGKLKQGNSFLVHGGTSGIGTTAIQLGKTFGATVYTTAGTNDKCQFCTKIGADAAINYREQNFLKEINNLTEGRGVDMILDMVGGSYINKNIKSLAKDGKLLQIALMEGNKCEIDFLELLLKRITIISSTLRARSIKQKSKIAKSLRKNVWPLLEKGILRPIIHKVFPLEYAKEAHILMESSTHIGKILLENKFND